LQGTFSKGRFFRLVVLPLAAGLAVSLIAYRHLSSLEASGKPPTVDVVVAARAIAPRTVITKDMLALKAFPKEFLSPAFLTSMEQAVGRVATTAIAEGEILYRSRLAEKGEKTGFSTRIPPGKRAVTVAVNEISGVAGLIEPGDRVDVLVTLPREIAGKEKSRLVIEDVAVIAVGQSVEVRDPSAKDVKTYASATLSVTPEQATLIAFGERNGVLKLALRSPSDSSSRGQYEVTSDFFR